MSRRIIALLTWLFASACSDPRSIRDHHGELSLALSTQASGHTYRLTAGTLSLKGPVEEEIAVQGDDPVRRTLPVGSYTLELRPNWELSRVDGDKLTRVEASLESQNPAAFVIGPGATSQLALRFALRDGTPVTMGTGTLEVSIALADDDAGRPAETGCAARLTINEVDYEQTGTDDSEFVEIVNLSGCPADLSGVQLEFVNGGDSKVYATIRLAIAGRSLPSGGRLVIGSPRILSQLPSDVMRAPLGSGGMQNGAPDAVRLVLGTQVLDAFSYEGEVASSVEGAGAGADEGDGAFARCPDGFDSQDNARDFRLTIPTPGAVNRCD